MDNHATTRVDPRVVEAMLPFLTEQYGNAGSITHSLGTSALDEVDRARASIAAAIGARPREIVFTSGATESNNLAIFGAVNGVRSRSKHIISIATEHRAVLDPLKELRSRGCDVTLLPVAQVGSPQAGIVDVQQLAEALRENTSFVSVMLANNEIGAIHPIAQIGRICREHGVPLHCDATQAVGRLPLNVDELGVDLLSFSAHKIHGPKGVGALFVRCRDAQTRLIPQILGGGQERGLRSGTLNVPGIVGFAKALELCTDGIEVEESRLRDLRTSLCRRLMASIEEVFLNGPTLDVPALRLANNLNLCFAGVDGDVLMMNLKGVAVSSGAACSTSNPELSHVLRAIGLRDDQVQGSLRFGLGRFNTMDDVSIVAELVTEAVCKSRRIATCG